jgi:hypothetical protein
MDQPGQVLELEALVGPIWLRAVGASQVNVTELQSAGGAVAYLTLNLALEKGKSAQAPVDLPKGTRTLRATRGYWSTDPHELRRRAADHHSARRLRHALMEQLDDGSGVINGELLDLWFEVEWERQQATTWAIWEVVEPQPTLDLTTGELIPGHLFEPIGELQPSRIPADLRELLPQPSEAAGGARRQAGSRGRRRPDSLTSTANPSPSPATLTTDEARLRSWLHARLPLRSLQAGCEPRSCSTSSASARQASRTGGLLERLPVRCVSG